MLHHKDLINLITANIKNLHLVQIANMVIICKVARDITS